MRGLEGMNAYGHFDDAQREYVITRPDMPLPWRNYLGCEDFFGIVSNTAGGYRAELGEVTSYRGATYRIVVRNPRGVCRGVKRLLVDGLPVTGSVLPVAPAGRTVSVDVELDIQAHVPPENIIAAYEEARHA